MSDVPKHCPNCGTLYKWYEAECSDCRVALVTEVPAGAQAPDMTLVSVFRAADPGVLPLATMALDEAGIDYVVRHGGISGVIVGERSNFASASPVDASPGEILVDVQDEVRARDLLVDLEQAESATPLRQEPRATWPSGESTGEVQLLDAETGAALGRITDEQLDWLGQHLELESLEDTDYFIDRETLAMLEAAGADSGLLDALGRALGSRDGIDVRWRRG